MPAEASQSGYCFVRFDVNTEGNTENIEVYKCSDDMFAASAVEAVGRWLYSPKLVDGIAVISMGITTKVSFKLSDDAGNLIVEPEPIDEYIDTVLNDNQRAKLNPKYAKYYTALSKIPAERHCCVRYDISQTGRVFNSDVVTCTDLKLVDDATRFVRNIVFRPAHYEGKNISSHGNGILVKFPENITVNGENPFEFFPTFGPEDEKAEKCQFE